MWNSCSKSNSCSNMFGHVRTGSNRFGQIVRLFDTEQSGLSTFHGIAQYIITNEQLFGSVLFCLVLFGSVLFFIVQSNYRTGCSVRKISTFRSPIVIMAMAFTVKCCVTRWTSA